MICRSMLTTTGQLVCSTSLWGLVTSSPQWVKLSIWILSIWLVTV